LDEPVTRDCHLATNPAPGQSRLGTHLQRENESLLILGPQHDAARVLPGLLHVAAAADRRDRRTLDRYTVAYRTPAAALRPLGHVRPAAAYRTTLY